MSLRKRFVNNQNAQIISIMGFFLILSVIVLATISANLSNVGTEISQSHSRATIPEFINIRDKFGTALTCYANQEMSIDEAFERAYLDFHKIELSHGIYFSATLTGCSYAGNTFGGAIYYVDATLSLDDGFETVTKQVVFVVSVFT
jgi:hypothetical protein